jgi:SAM-dependent methyltransferase
MPSLQGDTRNRPDRVRAFESNTPEYHQAFKTFLDHTDQKDKALAWLSQQISSLRRRQVLIDVGAGNGKLTAWLMPQFRETIAIEPSASLVEELRVACPSATIMPTTIGAAFPAALADFILCSHVFYYIPRPEWETNLLQMTRWLAPGGMLALAIQNPHTDCMKMVRFFSGGRLDLGELCGTAESAPGGKFTASVDTVPAQIRADDLATACAVAEFMLNVLPLPTPPRWVDLERYVDEHFRRESRYVFSCDQDFLRIERDVQS